MSNHHAALSTAVELYHDEDMTVFADTPDRVRGAVQVAEHLLADPTITELLGSRYVDALRRVTRQARRDVDEHAQRHYGQSREFGG